MDLLEKAYRSLDKMTLFESGGLAPKRQNGCISLLCPRCGQRRAFTYDDPDYRVISCNRLNNCGYKATYLQWISGQEKPRGESFKAALKTLQENGNGFVIDFATSFPAASSKSPEDRFAHLDYTEEYMRLPHFHTEGEAYLKRRKIYGAARRFGVRFASHGEWPHIHNGQKIRQWNPGRIVFPIYDAFGEKILNLYGRTIENGNASGEDWYKVLKHDFLPGAKGPWNMDRAASVKNDSVFIAEAIFDALSLVEKNHTLANRTISLNGNTSRLLIDKLPAKRLFFCLDPDSAGKEITHRLAEYAISKGKICFVLSKDGYGGTGDINDAWNQGVLKFDFRPYGKE